MRLIVAFLFAVISFGASAETLIPRTTFAVATVKPKTHFPVSRTKKIIARAAVKPGELDDNDEGGSDEVDVYVGYRRPEVVNKLADDNDLSDYIQTRLLIARARALKKFAETHGEVV